MARILPIVILFSAIFFACNESASKGNEAVNSVAKEAETDELEGWEMYEGPNFSIQYSEEDWTPDNSGTMGTSLILFYVKSRVDFKNNMNVYVEDLTGKNIDLDMYTELSKSQLVQYITNYQNVESERKKINGEECHMMIYTGTQGINELKWKQHYYIKDNKAYVVTYTCKKEDFDNSITTADAVFNTFKFK